MPPREPRIYSAEEARALRDAATAGPWHATRDEFSSVDAAAEAARVCLSRGGLTLHIAIAGRTPDEARAAAAAAGANEDAGNVLTSIVGNGPRSEANAALVAAAPDLAATVEHLSALLTTQTARADGAEAEALRLREECDGLRSRHADAHRIARDAVDALGRCVAERDEALRGVIPRGYVALTLGEADAAREAREALTKERDALRAIIEGRTTPPTDAEIAAHEAAGGRWLISHMHADAPLRSRRLVYVLDAGAADARTEARSTRDGEVLWVALLNGRPCPWPVVTEATDAPR